MATLSRTWREVLKACLDLGIRGLYGQQRLSVTDLPAVEHHPWEPLPPRAGGPWSRTGAARQPPEPGAEGSKPPPTTILAPPSSPRKAPEAQKGTGCAPCTADHLSTSAGALSEALRFARTRGVADPEVESRLALCVEELNIWERVDAAPEKLTPLTTAEKDFLHRWLPKGRELRHQVNEVDDLEGLEGAAALARKFSVEARKEMRQLRPPVMKKIEAVAKRVETGKLTKKQALGEMTEWWKGQQPEKEEAHVHQQSV